MDNIEIINRDITSRELNRVHTGFDEHTIENEVIVQSSIRFGYVAEDKHKFIGCSSGLAYKNGDRFSGYFYLTDLFVEKDYRSKGIGAQLLSALEQELKENGIIHIWTWTAGYEAPNFYQKQGYHIFTEMEGWYSDGSARVGFRKRL